ncbi:hypothetical protein FCH31_18780 [Lelliottia amnigena]|nr:hypothetical protein [Lelliottia amnigena]
MPRRSVCSSHASKIWRRDWHLGKLNGGAKILLRRASGNISMVGWTGASQDAPVSIKAGNANSVQTRHP